MASTSRCPCNTASGCSRLSRAISEPRSRRAALSRRNSAGARQHDQARGARHDHRFRVRLPVRLRRRLFPRQLDRQVASFVSIIGVSVPITGSAWCSSSSSRCSSTGYPRQARGQAVRLTGRGTGRTSAISSCRQSPCRSSHGHCRAHGARARGGHPQPGIHCGLRAKGLLDRGVFRHVVKNAAPTALAVMGLQLGYLLGGSSSSRPCSRGRARGSCWGRRSSSGTCRCCRARSLRLR